MSEKPEQPAASGSDSAETDAEKRPSSPAIPILSSRPPVAAPPRPDSNTPAPGASNPAPTLSGLPRPNSQNPAATSAPPRPRSSWPPAGDAAGRMGSSRPPPGPSGPPRPRMKSSPDELSGGTSEASHFPDGGIPQNARAPSFPSISQPPAAIIDTERKTPVPGAPEEATAEAPAVPQMPRVDLSTPPMARSSIPSPMSNPLGYDPEPSPFESALVAATEPEETVPSEPPVPHEAAVIANPIRAMRVIRIEETKKRSPSTPVLETVESSYEEIQNDLADVPAEALAPAPVPEDVEPISEVEPIFDLEGTDPADAIEVEIEPALPPPRPPAPSAGPTPPVRESQPDIPPADRKPPPPRRSARPSLPKATHPRKKAWWETIFGDDFSRAYRPMSQSQLAREVDFILEGLNLPKGAVILDLACGQGEICVELARRGYSVVGYDLSVYQLAMAGDNAQQAKQKINFLQGDMREMAFEEMFDAVICWDTSFGYFEDDKNIDVLLRIKKALKPGGRLILDVMNRDFAAREAPYNHWFEGDGCVCMDDMSLDWITNRLRVKRSIILDDGRSKELQYSTRLYTLSELGRVLHEVGFRVSAVSGDIFTKGAFFGPHSRRIIIQAGKP